MHIHEMINVEDHKFYDKFAERQNRLRAGVGLSVLSSAFTVIFAIFYCSKTFETPEGASAAMIIPSVLIAVFTLVAGGFILFTEPPSTITVHNSACTKCDRIVDNIALYKKKEKDWTEAINAKENRVKATLQRYATRNLKTPANTKKA